jgi:predicted lactoylglutathione lyase
VTTKIFVNLPVTDLQKSIHFFTELGYSFNPRFTDETATCMVVGDESFVMLLVKDRFQDFNPKQLADTATHAAAIIGLSADSRDDVDTLVEKALAAGAQPSKEPTDYGTMYGRSFQDLDGHLWEVFWMDPAALEQ